MTVKNLAKQMVPRSLFPAAVEIYLKLKLIYFAAYRLVWRPSGKYLAVAEKNYITNFPPEWTSVNLVNADVLLNLEQDYSFKPDSVRFAYSGHTIEHLSDEAAMRLLRKLHEAMQVGGVIRIEVPDLDMLLDDYKCVHNRDRALTKQFLAEVDRWNMPQVDGIYQQEHIKILAAIVSYFDRKHGMPLPPLCSKAEFDEKIATLSNREFGDWAVSLLTPEQLRNSFEHRNWFNFEKLQRMLNEAGFSGVVRCRPADTHYGFRMNINRTFRAWYSIFVEAVKK